jgi:hypothetical protein
LLEWLNCFAIGRAHFALQNVKAHRFAMGAWQNNVKEKIKWYSKGARTLFK